MGQPCFGETVWHLRCRLPDAGAIRMLTLHSVVPLAVWYTRSQRRRPIYALRYQTHRRLRFLPSHVSILHVFFLASTSLTWFWVFKIGLTWLQENIESFMMLIKNKRRWFLSSRVKLPFVNMYCLFGVNIFNSDFVGPNWFCQTTNPAKLCGFGTRVTSSDFWLQWSSWSQRHCPRKYEAGLRREKVSRLWQRGPPWITHQLLVLLCVFVLVLGLVFALISSRDRFPDVGTFFSKKIKDFYCQIPQTDSGNSVHAQTSIQRNNFRISWTLRHWSLSLHIQLVGTNVRLPKIHNDSAKGCCRIFKVASKVWVQEQSQSTMLRRITHMAIVCGHSCDECKDIKWAKRLSQGPVYQFWPHTSIWRQPASTLLDKSPTVSCSSFLKLWSSKQKSWNVVQLLSLFVGWFAISFHAFFACPSISCDHATVFA